MNQMEATFDSKFLGNCRLNSLGSLRVFLLHEFDSFKKTFRDIHKVFIDLVNHLLHHHYIIIHSIDIDTANGM